MTGSLEAAKHEYQRGRYADALRLARQAAPNSKPETQERECLICECIQFSGDFSEAIRLAENALKSSLTAIHAARYWGVIGRIRLDQQRREEAAEALRKGLRAAEKSSDLVLLAGLQQLSLVTLAEHLGAGLSSAVREAYQTAIRSGDPATLAGFHIRLARVEGHRGAFTQAQHHLDLAKSLLDRSDHVGLTALFHVNESCVLATTGSLSAARKSAERGAALADQAGHLRLAMASAANVSYIAIMAGELSVAESWLRKAKKTAAQLGVVEMGLLSSAANFALVKADYDTAREFFAEARRAIESLDGRWATVTETYTLISELYLHKKQGNRPEYQRVLRTARSFTDSQNDKHGDLLVSLAEAESLFDEESFLAARDKLAACVSSPPTHLVHRAELNRIAARSLWAEGHKSSARRRLLRACSTALTRGSRLEWAEALREMRSTKPDEQFVAAYSLDEQLKHGDSKFAALIGDYTTTWYERTNQPIGLNRDSLDGFDDAIAILESIEDPELLGREALASVLALNLSDGAALIFRGDAGIRVMASYLWTKLDVDNALKGGISSVRIDLSKTEGNAYELILKPKQDLRSLFAISGLRRLLEAAKAIESQKKNQQRLGSLWQPEIIVEEPDAVFSSPEMIELMQTARKVAATTLPVLLLGNTGTGKEVLARAIHRASPRANKVFLPFNCSAVPRDMVESQLFGYRRGSFTGAHADFPGIIRSAEGGTLFLDEIGELSMDLQPKLLRFLETNEVHPLGEGRPIKVDLRIIAATNADLDDLIQLKEFREDLYYRLNIVRFHMPQLCERREEIPPLVTHLVRRFEMDEKKHGIKFSDEMMEYLLLYKWPGNIRQLSNELRRMVAMIGSNETLTPEHLTPAIRATRRTIAVDPDADAEPDTPPADETTETPEAPNLTLKLDQPLPGAVEALERAMIEYAMTRATGNLEEAARLLGISRKGLFLKRRRWSTGGETGSNTA